MPKLEEELEYLTDEFRRNFVREFLDESRERGNSRSPISSNEKVGGIDPDQSSPSTSLGASSPEVDASCSPIKRIAYAGLIAGSILVLDTQATQAMPIHLGSMAFMQQVVSVEQQFMDAVVNGDTATVRRLLAQGVDIDTFFDISIPVSVSIGIIPPGVVADGLQGANPLMVAILAGNEEMIRFLLDNGAEVNKQENLEVTALMLATLANGTEIVQAVLDYNPNVNETIDNATALVISAFFGNAEIVELLIANGANVNRGISSLSFAALMNQLKVARILLDNGANINAENEGITPLLMALAVAPKFDNTEMIRLLIQHGADARKGRSGGALLHIAAILGDTEIIELLLDNGAERDINKKTDDDDNITPLMGAVGQHHIEAVELLLNRGADPNVETRQGVTALMLAATLEFEEALQALLSRNADVNKKDDNDNTALIYAMNTSRVGERTIRIIEMLIRSGIDVNVRNKESKTALDYAREMGNEELIRILIEAGARGNNDGAMMGRGEKLDRSSSPILSVGMFKTARARASSRTAASVAGAAQFRTFGVRRLFSRNASSPPSSYAVLMS